MTVHLLKCWPPYYQHVAHMLKPFEVRRDDRPYQPGDHLALHEWTPEGGYTGRSLMRRVTYVLRNGEQFGVQPGYVVLGLAAGPLPDEEPTDG